MAQSDAKAMPPIGQPYRMPVVFMDANDKVVKNWTAPSSTITSPDGTSAGAGPVPFEVGSSGMGWLDLSGAQMNTTALMVTCSIGNAGAQDYTATVFTVPIEGPPENPVVVLDPNTQQQIDRLYMRMVTNPKASDGSEFRLYDLDGVTVIARATASFDQGVNRLGELKFAEDA